MKRWRLLFKLEEEISISSRAASSGGHEGLPFIPGSALLGVAAQKLYRQLSQEQAFILFHSGKVRFGNLYPISMLGLPMLPIPLSWQVEKDQKDHIENNQFKAEKIYNGTAATPAQALKQAQQLRTGFVSEAGEHFLPAQNFRMKTAIDPKTGMADESKIFGYQSLANDALWYADIECDDNVDKNLLAAFA